MTATEETGENTLRDLLYDAAEAPGPVTTNEVVIRQLEAVCRYVDRLHALVRWFDRRLVTTCPNGIFPTSTATNYRPPASWPKLTRG